MADSMSGCPVNGLNLLLSQVIDIQGRFEHLFQLYFVMLVHIFNRILFLWSKVNNPKANIFGLGIDMLNKFLIVFLKFNLAMEFFVLFNLWIHRIHRFLCVKVTWIVFLNCIHKLLDLSSLIDFTLNQVIDPLLLLINTLFHFFE
jgi:hypothetical protein